MSWFLRTACICISFHKDTDARSRENGQDLDDSDAFDVFASDVVKRQFARPTGGFPEPDTVGVWSESLSVDDVSFADLEDNVDIDPRVVRDVGGGLDAVYGTSEYAHPLVTFVSSCTRGHRDPFCKRTRLL